MTKKKRKPKKVSRINHAGVAISIPKILLKHIDGEQKKNGMSRSHYIVSAILMKKESEERGE